MVPHHPLLLAERLWAGLAAAAGTTPDMSRCFPGAVVARGGQWGAVRMGH